MKKLMLVLFVLFLSGCTEFVAGAAAGATAMKKMAEDAQTEFIATVNELNAEKAKYDALIAEVSDTDVKAALEALIDQQTVDALDKLGKTDWKDPKVAGGYILALASLITAGYQKKRRMEGV